MQRFTRQDGSMLIMLIGVVAALAILSVSMVTLLGNVQHNTGVERSSVTAFAVAESGLDLGQLQLRGEWPTETTPAANIENDTIKEYFTGTTDLNAKITDASVTFFDNTNPANAYDTTGDNYMWVRSTATVNGRTSTVQAQVFQNNLPLNLRANTALYTDSDLNIKGTGSNNPIGVDPPDTTADTFAGGALNINGSANFPNATTPLVNPSTQTPPVTLDDVFPSSVLEAIVQEAGATGRLFPNEAAVDWDLVKNTQPHLCVVQNGDITGQSLWTLDDPGILVILNGSITFTGNDTIYGIIYCTNAFTDKGTVDIHGMVVAKGTTDLRGDRAVNYNSQVIDKLRKMVVMNVKIVQNTWRVVGND
jgi:Tfp pilus assembly protein PilX